MTATDRPLGPTGPIPRTVYISGVECRLEFVRIDDLVAWRKRNGLRRVRSAFLGRLGWASFNWPDNGNVEGKDG